MPAFVRAFIAAEGGWSDRWEHAKRPDDSPLATVNSIVESDPVAREMPAPKRAVAIERFAGWSPRRCELEIGFVLGELVDPSSVQVKVDDADRTAEGLASLLGELVTGSEQIMRFRVADKGGATQPCSYTVSLTAHSVDRSLSVGESMLAWVSHPPPEQAVNFATVVAHRDALGYNISGEAHVTLEFSKRALVESFHFSVDGLDASTLFGQVQAGSQASAVIPLGSSRAQALPIESNTESSFERLLHRLEASCDLDRDIPGNIDDTASDTYWEKAVWAIQ